MQHQTEEKNEDWERISLQESVYLQEDAHLFYEEMKSTPPQDRQPAKVINLSKNAKPNLISLRRTDKEGTQSGHTLHPNSDK